MTLRRSIRRAGMPAVALEFAGPEWIHQTIRRTWFFDRGSNPVYGQAWGSVDPPLGPEPYLTVFDRDT